MEAIQEIMGSVGLTNGNGQVVKKPKSSKFWSAARKLIPPKKGKGRRTAAEEKFITWIVAATESFVASPEAGISSVICLPCLDIKLVEKVPVPHPAFISPPVAKSEKMLITPSLNGVTTNHASPPKIQEPKPAIPEDSGIDKDLVEWMKGGLRMYLNLSGQKPHCGRQWGYRMAQTAVGFEVMSWGQKWVKEVFPRFVEALFEMLDGAKSTKDLDHLGYLLKDSVYLDLLAEIAGFQTNKGAVSVNFEHHYEDRYLVFTAADELLKGRVRP